jgi:uncharacterized membrane protein YqjE
VSEFINRLRNREWRTLASEYWTEGLIVLAVLVALVLFDTVRLFAFIALVIVVVAKVVGAVFGGEVRKD